MKSIKVLDHGYVTLRNISGPTRRSDKFYDADDVDPANSARMSFGAMDSGRTREMDLRLVNYLMKNHHSTPIEMIEVWIEMKMPIFIARQFVRHRTATINEISGRYVTLPKLYYIPEEVGGKNYDNAKQGQTDNLSKENQEWFKSELSALCESKYDLYEKALEQGIAPEHARLALGLNTYTHWLWKQDLHNLLHFLSLRDHPHAQIEAQKYAAAIDKLIRNVLPHTMELYDQHRRT
jgi:thymidylate synthase (FAD)